MDRRSRAVLSLAASAAFVLSARPASAEEDTGARFRGSFAFAAGPLITPGMVTLGVVGAEMAGGAQFNNLVALYAFGNIDLVFGTRHGGSGGFGVLVELKLNDKIMIAAGPELGYLTVYGTYTAPTWGRDEKGFLPAARLRFAWFLNLLPEGDERRRGFTLGVDVRLLRPMAPFFGDSKNYKGILLVSPMLTGGFAFW